MRSKGEGSVYQRADGRWVAKLSYIDLDGNKRQAQQYAKTKKEAAAKLRTMRNRVESFQAVVDSKETVASFAERWIATTLATSSVKASTRANKATLIRTHVVPELGHLALNEVTPLSLEKWLLKLQQGEGRRRPLSASTRRTAFLYLSQMLDTAVREQLIARNPAKLVDTPRKPDSRGHHFSAEQVDRILQAVDTHESENVRRIAPLVHFIAFTGVRVGEALAIRWSDVNFDRNEVAISGTVIDDGGLLVRQESTKTSRDRVIALPAPAIKALERQRTQQARERLAAGGMWTDSDLVFANELGGLTRRRNIDRWLMQATRKAKVTSGSWHAFRHAAATSMISNGVPMALVKDMLGHSSIDVTVDLYFHATSESMHEAAAVLAAAYGNR